MKSLPLSATFGYDEALVFFSNLQAQLVSAGATDANIVPWLRDCLVPPFVEAADRAQVAETDACVVRCVRLRDDGRRRPENDHAQTAAGAEITRLVSCPVPRLR